MEKDSDINKIVQQWALGKFYSTHFFKYMKNKFYDIEVDVNWSHVEFKTGEPTYTETIANPSLKDESELCSYKFKNDTGVEQEHSLVVEHTRTFKTVVRMTNSTTFRWKTNLRLGFPRKVANTFCDAEFGKEMSISSDDETAKEQVIKTHIETKLKVSPHCITTAKLIEKKKKFIGTFVMPVWIKGQVPISIRRKGKKPEFLHHCEASIFDIMKAQPQYAGFALDDGESTVKYKVYGTCEFIDDMDLTFQMNENSMDNALNEELTNKNDDEEK